MKKVIIAIVIIVAVFGIAGAIWWHEMNVLPNVSVPKPPPLPTPNAYDYFMSAHKLDIDNNKATWANANRPSGYKDPDDPDDRYYSLAEKEALLREYLPLVAKVREGFPYLYADPGTDEAPDAKMREVTRMVAFTGQVYAEKGDWNDAISADLDAVQLGEKIMHASGSGSLPFLTGLSCEGIGFHRAWQTIDHLTRAQTESAEERLLAIQADTVPLDHAYEESKRADQSSLMKMFLQPNWRRKNIPSEPLPAAYLCSDRTIMHNEIAYDNAWIEAVRRSYASKQPLPTVPRDAWHERENDDLIAYTPVGEAAQFGGSLNYAKMETWFEYTFSETQFDLLRTALALHAYQLDHGSYPNSLTQLTPAYLKRVPADPFALNAPLQYRVAGASYVLYSIGPDGKDDGGKPIYQSYVIEGETLPASHNFVQMDATGDIVAGVNVY